MGVIKSGRRVNNFSKSSSLRSLSSAAKVGLKPEELFTTPVSDITGLHYRRSKAFVCLEDYLEDLFCLEVT